ncbi:DUF2516 family protein [Nocardioides sp. GCM10027113]|uniref:DUF2516 family protein n=1 Tax=unclassified Nocardioides TaxID=2615069 RepID=UPI00360E426E
MPNVFEIQGTVILLVFLALLAVKVFAFVSAMLYSGESYEAAGKLTKPAWGAILGLGLAAHVVLGGSPINLINLAFTIAAFVYLADVRPALASLTRR